MPFQIAQYHFLAPSIFDYLSHEELSLVKKQMVRTDEKKGILLFTEDSIPKGVYILNKGKVKIYRTGRDGKEQLIYIYVNGEMMGYRPMICNEPHPVTAMVLEDAEIIFIPKVCFMSILSTSSALSQQLLFNLSHEFSVWINKITVFAQHPVRERVALALLILKEKYQLDDSSIDLSRDDLANYIGTTKETLVRALRSYKDEGVIKASGRKIVILKPEVLERLLDPS